MTNKLIVKDPFEMPAVDDTTVLVLRECADLVPHCWIWNESVGYLEVVTYSGYDIYVTVKNVGMKENATSGTIFPSCMEFLITAPNATPIIDNTVTCLRADFKCPTVGQEALMSVDSTSAIRTGDLIIVDTRYQYLVTEIINEHTMKVLNEEKGKEGGVIDVKCNECVPVKIFESTHCCEALQEQVDDIYNRIDTKKSVVSNNVLLSVDHGLDAISDVSYNIELDIDTDLSKYDNTTSQFITLSDIPPIPTVNDATLTIYNSDGVTPFIEFSANAASNVTATLPASGTTYTATAPISIDANNDISISQASSTTDGYLSSTDWNTFNNKSDGLVYFEESLAGTTATFQPKIGTASTFNLGSNSAQFYEAWLQYIKTYQIKNNYTGLDFIQFPSSSAADHNVVYEAGNDPSNHGHHLFRSGGVDAFLIGYGYNTAFVGIVPSADDSINLGEASYKWKNAYINNLYANNLEFNTTYADFNFTPITGGHNIATGKTIKTPGITISNPYTHGNMILFMVVTCNLSRLRSVSNSGTENYAGPRFLGYINNITTSTSWTLLDYYVEHQLTTIREDNSYSLTYTLSTTIPPSTTYTYQASIDITTTGFSNGTLTLPGGTYQKGRLEILYGHIN